MEKKGNGRSAGGFLPGKHVPLWIDTTPGTDYPPLAGSFGPVDVAVLGGGITGITTAALLRDAGLSVAVIEAGRIVSGVTGHTTAKITSQHGLIYKDLLSRFGEDLARLYGDANEAGKEQYAALIARRGIDCDFTRKSAYTYAETSEDLERVAAEVNAAKRLGLPASFIENPPLPFSTRGAVQFINQAQLHPRKYLLALADQLVSEGCHIFEKTRALEIKEGNICEVLTDRGPVKAMKVVVATHFPISDPAFYFARMYPKRSYVLGAFLDGPAPDGMFYSTTTPFHSIRTHLVGGRELVLIGGQNHKTGHGGSTIEMYRKLEKFARENLRSQSIEYHWSTQDNVTIDSVPYIGRLGPNYSQVFVATGFGGWGMAHGMVAALLLTDLILDRPNAWAELYDPNRLKRVGSTKLITENVHAVQHLVFSRVFSPDSFRIEELEPRDGGIIRHKLGQVAVAKDSDGTVHTLSPSCTHMGCILSWNDAEESWDCPCHGSRFTAGGEVLHGPAQKPLEKKTLD